MTTTDQVPGGFAVAIDGVPYLVFAGEYERATLDTIRQQADTSRTPGEATLNPNDLWRRAADDWILGAGQEWFDRRDSLVERTWRSLGANPWERGQLTLHKATVDIGASMTSAGSNVGKAVVANGRMYVARSTTLSYWDGSSWTDTGAVTGSGVTIRDIATDGFNVYIAARNGAASAGGLWVVTGSSDTPVKINNVIPDMVAFVKGRIIVGAQEDLYNVTDLGSTDIPDTLTALVNTEWQWTAVGEGPGYIYAAGHSNDTSIVYRLGIREDGTALQAAAVARQLPDGEVVRAIQGYRGLVVLGTDKGVRLAAVSGPGLQEGALIETNGPVYGLEPQGDYVWFTWSDLDGLGGPGLGRLDLSRFTRTLTPAYAADLQSGEASGTALSVVTYDGKRIFVVEDVGVFAEQASTFETSGYVESGKIIYGLADKKTFFAAEARHKALAAGESVRLQLYVDDSATAVIDSTQDDDGATDLGPSTPATVADGKGEYANLKVTMAGDGSSTPTLTRWLLRAFPIPRRSEAFMVPLDLKRTVEQLRTGEARARSPEDEFEALKTIEKAGLPVQFQEHGNTYLAFVDRVHLGPGLTLDEDPEHPWWQGRCAVTLRLFDV